MATILVAEDRAALRDHVRCMVERAGHTVELARNGAEAIHLYMTVRPDIVVLDLFMPVMNGFDALVQLREQFPEARVIAVSDGGATIGADGLDEAHRLGADRTIEKPLRYAALLTAIDELLAA